VGLGGKVEREWKVERPYEIEFVEENCGKESVKIAGRGDNSQEIWRKCCNFWL
jgi:hypothetical protein